MKIAVVYWSGTGHTEAMAQAVAKACGGTLFTAAEFPAAQVANFDAIAFGCPAMGAEVLEEGEFQPMFDECRPLRQEDRAVRLLRLGRRRVDAQLGDRVSGRGRDAGLRQRYLPG